MSLLALDLGGTKLALAVFDENGKVIRQDSIPLAGRAGPDVGLLIAGQVRDYVESEGGRMRSVGVSVPGISRGKTGTVWAPNISGWEDYPLLSEIKAVADGLPVKIDNDRACSILGELWQGSARGCHDAIFLAVGTGIGAGILVNGHVVRGADDIAGAVGWLALTKPYLEKYVPCGCFEYYASGEGIAKLTREWLVEEKDYAGALRKLSPADITAHHVFEAHAKGDQVAVRVMKECVEYWGMACANFVSIFNPEKIIFGGGVFGPAVKFIDDIKAEATRWAQPISITKVSFEKSALGGHAAIYGAGFLALASAKDN